MQHIKNITTLHYPLHHCFLAIPLPDSEKRKIFTALQKIKKLQISASEVADSNHPTMDISQCIIPQASLHINIYFFGRIEYDSYIKLASITDSFLTGIETFSIKASGVKFFKEGNNRHSLYLGISDSGGIGRIYYRFLKAVEAERMRGTININPPPDALFMPSLSILKIKNQQIFSKYESQITKILNQVSLQFDFTRLRTYAMIRHIQETPITNFDLSESS